MTPPEEPYPTASQTLVEAHETLEIPSPPIGRACAVQVDPPSVVPRMTPREETEPTASQTLVEGHEIPTIPTTPVGRVWGVQVDPPSVVPRIEPVAPFKLS
jgi:hypothetical protein